jgi:hypothetical protein
MIPMAVAIARVDGGRVDLGAEQLGNRPRA